MKADPCGPGDAMKNFSHTYTGRRGSVKGFGPARYSFFFNFMTTV